MDKAKRERTQEIDQHEIYSWFLKHGVEVLEIKQIVGYLNQCI